MRGLGERVGMATTAAGEDLTRMNELAAAPTSHLLVPTPADAGEQMTIDSESAEDGAAGQTGAEKVMIDYLDATGAEQTYEFTLNGTGAVNSTPTDIRFINDMYVSELGVNNTTGVATGHIFLHKTGTAGLVYNMIAAGGNKSLVPHRMVPLAKTLHLREWDASEKSLNKQAIVRLRSDCTNASPPIRQAGVHLFKSTMMLNATYGQMPLAYAIPALSIVKVSAWATQSGADIGCHWWGVLIDD